MQVTQYIGQYTTPEGFFGEKVQTAVVYDPELRKIVHVFPFGFHTSAYLPMDILDAAEAKWLIENHPNGKKYYR